MTASSDSLRGDWDALRQELDRWAGLDRIAWFWWRDDDAVDVTPALERLLALQRSTTVPLTLAVVPERATAALADYLTGRPAITAAQHGFAHINHAAPGEKKCEFPLSRSRESCLHDLRAGQTAMRRLFPRQPRSILVPPWNRFPAGLVGDLPAMGFTVLSGFRLRQECWAAPGLFQLNTHADPIDWKKQDGISGGKAALTAIQRCLQAMRCGAAPQQSLGLLTHHLRHDAAGWDFIAEFLARILEHPAGRWLDLEGSLDIGVRGGDVTPTS